jgi:hypothetical protein
MNHDQTNGSNKERRVSMSSRKDRDWSRREFLSTMAVAGTGALLGFGSELAATEPPLETTKLRLVRITSICQAPQYIAEELRSSRRERTGGF